MDGVAEGGKVTRHDFTNHEHYWFLDLNILGRNACQKKRKRKEKKTRRENNYFETGN